MWPIQPRPGLLHEGKPLAEPQHLQAGPPIEVTSAVHKMIITTVRPREGLLQHRLLPLGEVSTLLPWTGREMRPEVRTPHLQEAPERRHQQQ